MHANGDDFVVIDMRGATGTVTGDPARRLGDRHRGIGSNQLAVMLDCADAASKLVLESERPPIRPGRPLDRYYRDG